ncbi:hypothetical protein HZA97_06510 [Candidatus Woesearchaeota archaeon]|nr:hypothetical protein [Candidatus Woesearchaeota archaeon]
MGYAFNIPGTITSFRTDVCVTVGFDVLNFTRHASENCSKTLESRNDAMQNAMLALEESLTKGPREPTAFENKPEGSIEQVRAALDACMNCDYSKPSIVDVFIKKSQDFPK